jgi:heme/copper-type cytochrome/quinol oxidase subunit 2
MILLDYIQRKKFFLLFAASILLIAFSPIPNVQAKPKTVTIPVQAKSYAFSPGVIKVNRGDRVVLELTSLDVAHGLYLDVYNLALKSNPGQTARLSFVADKAGTFRFRCSVTCGALHPFMMGKLKVGINELVLRGTAFAIVMGIFGLWRIRNE